MTTVIWSIHSHANCASHLQNEKRAAEMVRAGHSLSAVGKSMGVSRGTVANWCKKHGTSSSYPANAGDARIDRDVVALVNGGLPYGQVARMHNININRVKRICKKHGAVSHHIRAAPQQPNQSDPEEETKKKAPLIQTSAD